ncbi:hypothetical protein BH11GEM1_BH11GEM1_28730 [soil metagenome]
MPVISRKKLLDFSADHPDAKTQLLEWDRIIAHKRYANTAEVKADFPSVDFIGQGKAVFNIVGNKYRLVVEMILRGRGLALIRHVVTHAEYDRLIARKRLCAALSSDGAATMATAVLDFTTPHVLRNAREYKAAVAEIDRLIDAGADERTRASEERLEFLSLLVEAYEEEHYPRDESWVATRACRSSSRGSAVSRSSRSGRCAIASGFQPTS